jgi:hypothetical protein
MAAPEADSAKSTVTAAMTVRAVLMAGSEALTEAPATSMTAQPLAAARPSAAALA